MPRKTQKTAPERPALDRNAWLDAALDALYEEGEVGVRVEPLARRLGVTKGSFYHHFRDREELVAAMVDRWRATQDAYVDALRQTPRRFSKFVISDTKTLPNSGQGCHDAPDQAVDGGLIDPARHKDQILLGGDPDNVAAGADGGECARRPGRPFAPAAVQPP